MRHGRTKELVGVRKEVSEDDENNEEESTLRYV